MATDLNVGFINNNNVIVVRTMGVSTQKLTDRSIDLDGDGNKEEITVTHVSGDAVGTASAPGGKVKTTVVTPDGFKNTIIERTVETDGGLTGRNASEFTEGVN